MGSKIQMAFHRPRQVPYVSVDDWRFEPSGRWAWLQKQAWKFLLWTRGVSNAVKETTEYKTITIDTEKVAESILKAMREAERLYIRPTRVYMGPKQIDELVRDTNIMHSMGVLRFDVRMGYDRTIYGLPVNVIPWMDGVLVLDD